MSLAELDELTEITRSLQLKYMLAGQSSRSSANREFRIELDRAQDALRNLRAKPGESTNSIFARTILHILKRGPLSTQQMHPMIAYLHPDLCDDSIDRMINNVSFGKRWKHLARNAQQHLKSQGLIEYRDRKWCLA